MNKCILLLFFVLNISSLKAQQYSQGIPIDTTIVSDYYNGSGCSTLIKGSIELDSSLFNYVTGLKFQIVFDSVAGVVQGPTGAIHSHDTAYLNAVDSMFSYTLFSSGASIQYHVNITGTPLIADEAYPCSLEVIRCTCFCPDDVIIKRADATPVCYVIPLSMVSGISSKAGCCVYPNPFTNELRINDATKEDAVLYDVTGKEILYEKIAGAETKINTTNIASGFYLLRVGEKMFKVIKN